MMSLGTGALQVGRGPEHYRHSKEVSMATLQAEPPKLTGSPRCLERGGAGKQGDKEPLNYPQTTPSTVGFQPVLGNKKENNRNTHTMKSRDPPAEGAKGQSCYRNQR